MPAIFFGHGNPLNAITENDYTVRWKQIGNSIPRPKAILSISAHWYIEETAVTAMNRPRTIHDFGGFPEELYLVKYPAPGNTELARRIPSFLDPVPVRLDQKWGLDHGTWSVLHHVFPDADIPVIQLSLNEAQPPWFHFQTGRRLARLRDEGILIIGSGNLVHNLHAYGWGKRTLAAYDWALRFEKQARELMVGREHEKLIEYESLGRDAVLSVPTPDHYLPLLYILALRGDSESITFPAEGFDGGSVSMLSVQVG